MQIVFITVVVFKFYFYNKINLFNYCKVVTVLWREIISAWQIGAGFKEEVSSLLDQEAWLWNENTTVREGTLQSQGRGGSCIKMRGMARPRELPWRRQGGEGSWENSRWKSGRWGPESQARNNVGRIYKAMGVFELGHDTIRALISEVSPGKMEDGF